MTPSVRRLPVWIAALVVAGALTACSGSGEGDSATAPAAPAESSATASPSDDATPAESLTDDENDGTEPAAVADILKFTGTTTAGDAFDGTSLAGRPTVLWFWAPWCPTCQRQMPEVSRLATEFGDSVTFVGVGGLDGAGPIEGFAADAPQLTHLSDPEGSVWRHFEITEQSVYVILDAEGEVVHDGYLNNDDLAATVQTLAG